MIFLGKKIFIKLKCEGYLGYFFSLPNLRYREIWVFFLFTQLTLSRNLGIFSFYPTYAIAKFGYFLLVYLLADSNLSAFLIILAPRLLFSRTRIFQSSKIPILAPSSSAMFFETTIFPARPDKLHFLYIMVINQCHWFFDLLISFC